MNRLKFLIFLSVFFMACEEQPIPIPDPVVSTDGRVMLIEDFTGVNCVPCFGATAFINGVLAENENSVIALGIHGGLQSEPIDGSKYDFRFQDAMDLESNFNVIGKPAATFNRVDVATGRKVQLNSSTWQRFIDQELQRRQVADLFITTSYSPETRQVEIEVSAVPLEDIDGLVNVHVIMAESHLLDSQNSPSGVVVDFEHNHVLKESLTSLQGNVLGTNIIRGEIYRERYTYSIPATDNGQWLPENMEVIAFVTAAERSNSVQQAALAPVIE